MRTKPEGLVLGPARLLILGMLACLAGCLLALFLGASPASAADVPHAEPRVLGGLTATVLLAEQRASTVTDTNTSSIHASDPGQAGTPLEKLGHATRATTTTLAAASPVATALHLTARLTTGLTTELAANVAGLAADLSLSGLLPSWLPPSPTPAAIAQVPTTTSPATPAPMSTAATASASSAATIAKASAASPPAPSNGDPAAPPAALVGATSSSAGSDGGAAVAAPSDAAWTPVLDTGLNATRSDSVPASSNDGSDPAPD